MIDYNGWRLDFSDDLNLGFPKCIVWKPSSLIILESFKKILKNIIHKIPFKKTPFKGIYSLLRKIIVKRNQNIHNTLNSTSFIGL